MARALKKLLPAIRTGLATVAAAMRHWLKSKHADVAGNEKVSAVNTRSQQTGRTTDNPSRGDQASTGTGRSRIGMRCLAFIALLGAASQAQAGLFCSDYPNGIIDGSDPVTVAGLPTQITIDRDCTFLNFTASNPLTVTINYQTNDPSVYLIVFDNVIFTGNMACSNIDHKIWFSNGSDYGSKNNCQDLFIPVETIAKENPAQTTVGVGEAFTYTLTLPSMQVPLGDPSPNELYNVIVGDNLAATGADLTFVSINAYYTAPLARVGEPVTLVPETDPAALCGVWTPKNLCYEPIPTIAPGEQIVVEITVVADDTPANVVGTQFINTAKWWFGREIDIDGDGIITPAEMFTPLPGEWGVTQPMTIGEPNLVVTKTSPDTALNLGIPGTFTIDVQNSGGSNAWNATILDQLPDGLLAGMCDTDPSAGLSAQVFAADGVTPVSAPLVQGVDYSVNYAGAPTCQLSLTMLTPAAVIGPTERLIITYQTQLDADTTNDGTLLTNIAGATQWFSATNTYPRRTYTRTLTDGTPAVLDHEDNYTIITGLSGYYFQKTARNLTSGENPAATATPGDTLRYRLRIFNVDETIDSITINDTLDPTRFDTSTFSVVSIPASATYNFNPVTGLLQIVGNGSPLNVAAGNEFIMDFDIKVLSPLANGTVVSNQATFTAAGPLTADSDNPYVNGIAGPGEPADATDVVIHAPGPLTKVNGQASATVGGQFTYTITVPATPVDVPLYDVRILDDLTASNADMSFVSASVVSGGAWNLVNTGTSTSLVIVDTSTGIDIPANGQAVIAVTVQLMNTMTNQTGLSFNNSATYTFNRTNGVSATQTAGVAASTTDMTVLEPHIGVITKSANNLTPTAGSIVRYTVTLTANSGAGFSDVFDVSLTDNLDLGLAYAGNPTVSTGVGISADNVIRAPDITGDGVTIPQTLVWGLNANEITDIDIPAGSTIVIAYDVRVLNGVLANQTLNNSAVARWTSVDGVRAGERDGSDGIGLLNDYVTAPVTRAVTTRNLVATITKTRSNDTYGAGDNNVRVGDVVEYTLSMSVPEGTLGNVSLVDTLPQGLDFTGIVSINGNTGPATYPAVAPFSHADIPAASVTEAGDPALGPTTVTWNLGNVTNLPNDGLNNNFVIVYRARVLNNLFAHSNLNIPLNNRVVMSYNTASGTVTASDIDTTITVLQPMLTVSKTAAPAGGDIFIGGNELVTYTVDVTNTGTAPAYDLVLQDVIPVGMRNGAATVTMMSTTLAGTPVANVAPVYNAGSGLAVWNFDTGVANAYTIGVGQTLRVVYQVQVDAGIAQGLILTNSAQGTSYYSFDDEAVPTLGGVSGSAEMYGPTNIAATTLYTSSPPTKALITPAPASPEMTVGEEVVYQIAVPGTASSGSLYDLQITDTLDANLEFVSATVTGGVGVSNTSTATQMNIAITQIPSGTQAMIELHTRVRNVLTAQQGVDINNTVSYSYALTAGGATQPVLSSSDIVTVNVIEPNISTITKIADNITPTAGEIVRYTVTLTASGGTDLSDVFDVTLTDNLGLGLAYEGNPTVSVGAGVSADNTIGAPVINGDGVVTPQTLVWSLANGNADIDIDEGTFITVAYDVRVLNTVLANQMLTNSVTAQWTGIDGANVYERHGADGVGGLNDYVTAPAVATLNSPNLIATINKVRSNDTYGPGDDDVRIGDIVEYTLTLSVPEGTLGNLQLVDTLPQGLDFEGIVSINGDIGPAPYSAVAPFSHADILASSVTEAGNPATGSTTVTWNIGNVNNQPIDTLNNDFVIVYRARVLNNVFAHTDLNIPLNNVVDLNYATATGTVTQSDVDTIITALQPQLTVSKTAAPAGGDTEIIANELVTYTVNVVNGGTAPAYDLELRDIIPIGMRNGAATITMQSTTLGGVPVGGVAPVYDPLTGVATWNFDTGVANEYVIGVGQTLTIVYQAQADADLGAGLTLTNAAVGNVYYSFDDEAVPSLGTVSGIAEVYGPTNTATTTLTSPLAGALSKANPADLTVSVGETFTYTITVPAAVLPVTLHDVRILDDLGASAADLSFVSVTKVGGSLPWVPVNTGNATNLVIEDTTNGIDIPAGDQAVIEITVQVNNTPTNVSGLLFSNTADYTFNQVANTPATQQNGLPASTGNMTIVGPDNLTLEKSGPSSMRIGLPATFTLNVHNTGTAPAYDTRIIDYIPNPVPGGMCDVAPFNITAQLYLADGVTTVGAPLVQNTDFTVNFIAGTPSCNFTLTMLTPAAAIPADNRLIITYDVTLDADSANNTFLTNIAGATQWFSLDTAGAGATGQIRTYSGVITDGTVGTLDNQDAHLLITESPTILFQKSVTNVTTGQSPGNNGTPGDVLRYRIVATNVSPIDVPNFSIIDEVDRLNSAAAFAPGTLNIISVPAGADISNTDPNGGSRGTGILDVRNLSMTAGGGGNDVVTIEFEVTLAPAIDSGTVVLNQALLQIYNLTPLDSDDPDVNGWDNPAITGDEDPTPTLIASAPAFEVQKISDDITGSATQLLPGETLRYTITVKNVGNENTVASTLKDQIPDNTSYIAGTTTLNGVAVADPAAGISAIEGGMLINAPGNTTPGFMAADATANPDNVAIITFDVMVDSSVINGTILSNQAFFNASGAGISGPIPQQGSDDPATPTVDDPTRDIVGSLPLIETVKAVALQVDNGLPGIVDGGDVLRYTIAVRNYGGVEATGVTLTDTVPANTTYLPNSVFLNGLPVGQPDGGVSPLIAGIAISSSDLTPPLPTTGIMSAGGTATVTFDVTIDMGTPFGTIISNQGFVASNEVPTEPTDADGLNSNGNQPTLIAVGDAQSLAISKSVSVVGGGPVTPGGELEYVVLVTNVGLVAATDVVITDNLNMPVAGHMSYVQGSAMLNGLTTGISYVAPVITANYSAAYGPLQPGQSAELRFRVVLGSGLLIGDTITNIADVTWNAGTQTASATVAIDVGATPGVANLNGRVWHDVDFDNTWDETENPLENWTIEVWYRGAVLHTVTSDVNGVYRIQGLSPNYFDSDRYELRFISPGAGVNTARLGEAVSTFTNSLQQISNIVVYPNTNLQNLDLPIDPDGVIYDSIMRVPVTGATVTMLNASSGVPLPATCFDDPMQQNQVTLANGFYKFDLNFSQSECSSGADYILSVTAPTGYYARESLAIPPLTNAATAAFSVPACLGGVDDAVTATTDHCEVQVSAYNPPLSVAAGSADANYYLHLTLANGQVPGESQLFNNHIPLDPELGEVVTIRKTTSKVNVSRADLVPYSIVINNSLPIALAGVAVVDDLPPGFKYVQGSGRINGVAAEPMADGLQLIWNIDAIDVNVDYQIDFLLIVGAGVHEGEYVNRAHVFNNLIQDNVSGEGSATVRVVPDPTFDCSDIIGKVFDDRNLNGQQDEGEPGIAGVRLATARGLLVTTDKHGRFHVTCAAVPNEERGSNFILKLDERSLPSGYRVTSENPRVQRLTRGKMARFNFAATVHHVVTLSVADGVFQPDSAQIRPQWLPRFGLLIEKLREKPAVLRLTYLADVESSGLVSERVDALKARIQKHWQEISESKLSIETEVFWRHGGPVDDFGDVDASDVMSGISGRASFGEDTEMQLPRGYTYMPWKQDESLFKVDDEPKFEIKQVAEQKFTTKKLKDLVPPIPFKSGKAEIPEDFVSRLREVLNSMRDRVNVRLHFIGHSDNVKLSGPLREKFEDNTGLSKERAGTTAEFFQRALELPPEAISYEGVGETMPIASNDTEAGRALNRRVEVQVWYDEVSEEMVDRKVEVDQEIKRIMVCRVETVCKLRYKEGHSRRTKLKNLVPPFHYDEGVSVIPPQYIQQLKQALNNLSSKENVQMRFIAFTDNIPLTGRDARIYGDHVGLSKANARRVALAIQEAMGLPNEAIASTGKGAEYPVASNNSEKGRALNRRIEVEFWHDDALEDLPDEPQICPEAAAAETVERIYNPPEGDIKPIYFEDGKPVIPEGYSKRLTRAMEDIKDKGNVRLRFIGYTSNNRLDRRTAMVYGDDIGLSTARARRAMEAVQSLMSLTDKQVEFEGHGYLQSNDVVNTGFLELDQSKVEVQVVYDELAVLDEMEGVSIKRITRDVETRNPFALNLMRISVDGQPVNDPNKNIPDVQRCTDVALDQAQVRFKFDNLQIKPRLNVIAWPNVISHADNMDTAWEENLTHFALYTNYPYFIEKAEVRLFRAEQSTRDTPLAVVALGNNGEGQWKYTFADYAAPRMELKYVLRVYDKQGNFDETTEQSLWVVDALATDNSKSDGNRELLVGYGENRLALNNIPLHGGVVRVYGEGVPQGHQAWFAGRQLPVSEAGEFGGEFILPSGLHTVEVAITDKDGNGNVYQRDLALENSDWFVVGIADLTLSADSTNGPAELVTNGDTSYDNDANIDGRLAFYAKGRLDNESVVTASADTREGPVEDLFSNYMSKSPDALFRRMDPDYFYPTYGDDSTVEEDAPTSGKLYLKWEKDANYGLWGNFDIEYLDNNLAHVDRSLYGANLNYETESATAFGDKRFASNLFAAEPGTVAGRDEFLGTGGSLYYLQHQDILSGSDRLHIEVRDRITGLVVAVKTLSYGLDYDIDYIQGRVMLDEPLSAATASDMLVDSADYGGNDVYLVVRYEYTPGFDDINDIMTGGRLHAWLTDWVKLGVTAEDQEVTGVDTSLRAYDLTLRKNAGTWLKFEKSTSQGPVSSTLSSSDGGYNFNTIALATGTNVEAEGQRVDASVRLQDIFGIDGTFSIFNQKLDAGYAAPGLIAQTDTTQTGAMLNMPVYAGVNVKVKADAMEQENGLETEAKELNLDYAVDDNWTVAAGLRKDKRVDNSTAVPLTQQQGERTDLAYKATYDSREDWVAYGFVQNTTNISGNRDQNARTGVGGDYRITDRFKIDGEFSDGDLGTGIKLGTDYKMTDTTDIYSSYTLENERTDNGVKARKGNMSTGFKSRYSDSASIYMEEKYTHGDVPTGLTHAMGYDLVLTDNLNFGGNVDIGTLKDNNTGAETKRTAVGFKLGYKFESLTYAGAVEYRVDETEQPDTSFAERTTWLMKNSIKYQLNPGLRLLGKFNRSQSESSLGDVYNGDFTEAVLGSALRPVDNDAVNALFKYTYFYNMPTTDQITLNNSASQYVQKSHIFSVDAIYELTRSWSLGGKYAYRLGKLALDRQNPQFFENDASLYILRADWHFIHEWDALIEGRLLEIPNADDRRSGFLMGLYRQVDKHLKTGVGYNFTDFSDDLTDLDYDSHGFFINLIGKF